MILEQNIRNFVDYVVFVVLHFYIHRHMHDITVHICALRIVSLHTIEHCTIGIPLLLLFPVAHFTPCTIDDVLYV